MTDTLEALLETAGLIGQGPLQPLSGGDIAAVYRLTTDQGDVVVKSDAPERLSGEAEGLQVLANANSGLIVPEVLGQQGEWLVIEALETAPAGRRSAAALGEGLRKLHGNTGDAHGWPRDNACGSPPQPNKPLLDGRAFQRERRLLPLAQACYAKGLLDKRLKASLKAIAESLETWLEDVPASLVHGDLWSGNVLYTSRGPAIIDPAVYRHYPEVDLAMLTLFGAPGGAFFEAYWDGSVPADWHRRETLFQLYPLLNHLLLFGGGYRQAVVNATDKLQAMC